MVKPRENWFLERIAMAKLRMTLIMMLGVVMLSSCAVRQAGNDDIARLKAQINSNFRDPVPHFELAQIYQNIGDFDKAAYEYDTTLQLDPVNREAQAAIVKVYRLAGAEDKASDAAKIYMKSVSGTPEDSLALGRAFENAGLGDMALASYEQALRMAPNSGVVHKQIGYYYLNKKDKDMALKYFKKSFELDPYDSDVGLELGRLGVKVGVEKKK